MRNYQSNIQWGPTQTPKAIKILLLLIGCSSIGIALLEALFVRGLGLPSPHLFLDISSWGAYHFMVWQPFTYLFVHRDPNSLGVSINLLIEVGFHLYILWLMGTTVIQRIGTEKFLWLFLGSGAATGTAVAFTLALIPSGFTLAGSTPALLSLFVFWVMLHPDAVLYLFFVFPVKARWLLAGIIGTLLLINLSQGDFIDLGAYMCSLFFGYLFAIIVADLNSPFEWLEKLESNVRRWRRPVTRSKIVDISGKPLERSDDRFMDQMLEKISKNGVKSLTLWEKLRMWWISRRR